MNNPEHEKFFGWVESLLRREHRATLHSIDPVRKGGEFLWRIVGERSGVIFNVDVPIEAGEAIRGRVALARISLGLTLHFTDRESDG